MYIKYYELFRRREPRLERPPESRITNRRCVSNCESIENGSRKQNDSTSLYFSFLFDKFGRSDEINLTVSVLVVVVSRLSFIRGRIYLTSRTLYLKYLFYFASFLRIVYVTVWPWARVFTIEYPNPCALCARCAAECRRYYHICLFVRLIGIDFFSFHFSAVDAANVIFVAVCVDSILNRNNFKNRRREKVWSSVRYK